MKEAVIVSTVRTAVGRSGRGALATTRPDDLAATAIEGALARLPQLDRNEIEDVILGCAMPEAEQGMNVARIAALPPACNPSPWPPSASAAEAPKS
jgi:acetyl-CoA acyltransferase